jgi:hypothetical protein
LLSITIDTSTPPSLTFIHILGFLEGEAGGGGGKGTERRRRRRSRRRRRNGRGGGGGKKNSCGLQFPTKVEVKTIS